MIKITKTAANRIDMEFDASSIDEETMRAAIEELIEKSDGIEHGQLLYRLHRFPWPSLSAMAVKLEHLPELFKLRSEEHTSELQSHHDLVCRLLLEKKKQHQT